MCQLKKCYKNPPLTYWTLYNRRVIKGESYDRRSISNAIDTIFLYRFSNRYCKLWNKRKVFLMRHQVKLFVAGTVFTEDVVARNYDEARQVALARNPNATIVSVNVKF